MLVDNCIFCFMLKILPFKVAKIFKADLEQLQIGNSNIQWSDSMKYMGIVLASVLLLTLTRLFRNCILLILLN